MGHRCRRRPLPLSASISVWTRIGSTRSLWQSRIDAFSSCSTTASGGAYQAEGDSNRAIEDFTKTIEINPQDAKAYVRRGSVYQVNGDGDHAIADYNKAIEIDPLYAIAYFNRGGAFEAKGDRDHAIADYTKAIETRPLR